MYNLSKSELEKMGAWITTTEIKQQPELWLETYNIYKNNKERISEFLNNVQQVAGNKMIKVIFTGAGTSQYVGDTVLPYLKSHGDRKQFIFESVGTTDIVASPYHYLFEDEVTILVSFARSGNSPESVKSVELANQIVKNIFHLTLTCAKDGQLAKQSQNDKNSCLVLMPEKSNDAGFAMTGSFTCMLLSALLIFDVINTDEEKLSYVEQVSQIGKNVLEKEDVIQSYVNLNFDRIVYLGSGSFAPLTREAQLKVLELTAGQLTTMYDSSMGFRHGPKSYVNNKTIVFCFVHNNDYTRQYDVDILEEIYQDNIAVKTVAISQENDVNYSGETFTLIGKPLPDGYLTLAMISFAQTISLLCSIKVNNTPDTPSKSGTVNRVVKGVILHDYK